MYYFVGSTDDCISALRYNTFGFPLVDVNNFKYITFLNIRVYRYEYI